MDSVADRANRERGDMFAEMVRTLTTETVWSGTQSQPVGHGGFGAADWYAAPTVTITGARERWGFMFPDDANDDTVRVTPPNGTAYFTSTLGALDDVRRYYV